MRPRMDEPVGYTCNYIDRVIEKLSSVVKEMEETILKLEDDSVEQDSHEDLARSLRSMMDEVEESYKSRSYRNESPLEELRKMNGELREWGNELAKYAQELESEIRELEDATSAE